MGDKKVENQHKILIHNIDMLEHGITLQEYLANENQIKINDSTSIYDSYGVYVIYNKTKNLYFLGSMYTRPIDITIHMYFVEKSGHGNPYLHEHYADGDTIILKYYRLDNTTYPSIDDFAEKEKNGVSTLGDKLSAHYMNILKFLDSLAGEYDLIGENYYDYIVRITDYREKRETYRDKIRKCIQAGNSDYCANAYYSGNLKKGKMYSFVETLIRLKKEKTFLYEVLNAIVDLLVKPIPLAVFLFIRDKGSMFAGENIIQNILTAISMGIGIYIFSILTYMIVIIIIQIIRKERKVGFKILDSIIKFNSIKKM